MRLIALSILILMSLNSFAGVERFVKAEDQNTCPKDCAWVKDELTDLVNVCKRTEHCVYSKYSVEKDICEFDTSETVSYIIDCSVANFEPNFQ